MLRINKDRKRSNLPASIVACLVGLLVGFLVLLVSNPENAVKGFTALLTGAINGGFEGFGNVIAYAGIYILCGLSVGFAGKTGVFNIGGSGQFIVGGAAALYVGILWTWLPAGIHCLVAIIAGAIAGAVWGALIGLLKALFNVSEVVVGILLNYIGLYLANMLVLAKFYNPLANRSQVVASSALVPTLGLDKLFPSTGADATFVVAVFLSVVVSILLNKTTFGYEVRTCGYNKDAGTYSGINAKKNTILAMAFAGALPGLAGAMFYLSSSYNYITIADSIPSQPMSGICVSLIAMGDPIGIIFSSLFVSYITVSGLDMQLYGFVPEIVNVVTSVIIYCCAFVILINKSLGKFSLNFIKPREGKIK
ncbi:MAG: ABC transporter permease [Anaerolineaceae bacterium]